MIVEKKFKSILNVYDYIEDGVDPFEAYDFLPCSVKLESGASILANIAQVDEKMCILFCPFSLEFSYDEMGETAGFSLAKFTPGSDEVFFLLPIDKIVATGIMNETCYETYEKAMETMLESTAPEELEKTEKSEDEDNVVEFKPKSTIH